MKTTTNFSAIVACLGGFGIALCAIGVILLATGASAVFAGIALTVGIALFAAMGVSLGVAVRRQRAE